MTATRQRRTPKPPPAQPCRTTQYARDVLAGRVVTNRLVRLACERHLRDQQDGDRRGLKWDQEKADHTIGFFEDCLCLSAGRYEGQPFLLQPWQCFIVGSLFGW